MRRREKIISLFEISRTIEPKPPERVSALRCFICGHVWVPKSENIENCPNLHLVKQCANVECKATFLAKRHDQAYCGAEECERARSRVNANAHNRRKREL